MTHLGPSAPLAEYERQAASLLADWRAGDAAAREFFHRHHPRLRDEKVAWLPRRLSEEELKACSFDEDDARRAVARWYDFADWDALAELVEDGTARPFECAADAVVTGDSAALRRWLAAEPGLARARSRRRTPCDPPVQAATLLHYVAANGVEGYRQKSPANAVEVARLLLDAGAEVDAVAFLYGGACTTMALLVSSCHPAEAGVQVPLVHLLVDYGAALTDRGAGSWTSPVETALVFGYTAAARALLERGAPVTTVAAAAGLSLLERVAELLPTATALDRRRALALAAQLGEVETTRRMLDAGEDPNRFNPPGTHAHATPLHQAALAGHRGVVELLVARGARLDLRDEIYGGTPAGWAEHGGHPELAAYLREISATQGGEAPSI